MANFVPMDTIAEELPSPWRFALNEPVELALEKQDSVPYDPARDLDDSTISPETSNGLGLTISESDFFHQGETLDSAEKIAEQRIGTEISERRINQHIYEVLQAADRHREHGKRVRFDDLGASPRKRARMANRMEDLLHDDSDGGDLCSSSDLMKLQMLALASYQQDKERMQGLVEVLEKEVKKLVRLNQQQTERRLWVVKEVLRRRAGELKAHADFLLALAEEELSA